MADRAIPHRLTGARFFRSVRGFATSEVGGQARWMFAGLIAFLLAINGMNVVKRSARSRGQLPQRAHPCA
jgi:putative ATP-binding cassette transporter